jgi:uncharacterized DUF497 family protein
LRYNFEWDPAKAKENLREHKVSFERAATVFVDSHAISIFDEEHSQDEDRWITLGIDSGNILIVVSHTFRTVTESSSTSRIISARRATPKEVRNYEERI